MIDIRWYSDGARRYSSTNLFSALVLLFSNTLHSWCDDSLPSGINLRDRHDRIPFVGIIQTGSSGRSRAPSQPRGATSRRSSSPYMKARQARLASMSIASKKESEPVSRVLWSATIYLDFASPRNSSTQPECTERRPYCIPICACFRWGLPSHAVTSMLVRSYRTVSAFLPKEESSFLWHYPSGRPAQPLTGILPFEARTFLTVYGAVARLTPMVF